MDDLSTTTENLGDIADILQKRVLDSPDVTAFIDQLAHHAADTLSSAAADVFCSVTLLQGRNRTRSAASGETAKHMDETQYAFGDGPCLTSARDGTVVHVADTATEPNWRAYLDTIDDTGIRSILAVPFELAGDADGALNLYATEPGVFTEETLSLAQRYADEASMSLRLAVRIGRLAETQENLHAAMRSRTVIDIAVGILMAQNSCGQQAAFRLLKTASANRNVKLHDVATRVVASVSPEPVQTHFTGDGA